MTVPATVRALDPHWVAEQLIVGGHLEEGEQVVSVTVEALPFVGATSDMARVHVTYGGEPSGGPSSMVAKIRGRDAVRAEMDAGMQLFARETHFYRELAALLPIRTPRAFAFGDGDHTPLMLEDLGGLRAGDQSRGMSIGDAERCVEALADLHAAYWCSPRLADPQLLRPREGPFAAMTAQLMASGVATLRNQFVDEFGSAVLELVPRDPDAWAVLLDQLVAGPQTLIHNDCRADNLFFGDDGTPIFVDWQLVAVGRASQDLANLLAGSIGPGDLSGQWRPLLQRYHDALVRGGVSDYPLTELIDHYRQSVVWPLGQGLSLLGGLSAGDDRRVGPNIVRRALTHAVEVDAFGAFGGRGRDVPAESSYEPRDRRT